MLGLHGLSSRRVAHDYHSLLLCSAQACITIVIILRSTSLWYRSTECLVKYSRFVGTGLAAENVQHHVACRSLKENTTDT